MKNWFNVSCFLVLCAFFVFSIWSAHSVFILDNPSIYAENGLLETLQAILLVIGCIVFLVPVALHKESGKLILLFCSLLCYSFVVRELDVELLNVPAAIKFLCSGVGRNTTLAVAFSAMLLYALSRFSYYKKAVVLFLGSLPGILLMLGGVLLVVGDLFEKRYSLGHHVFFEEFLELSGYVSLLLSSLAANSGLTRRSRGDLSGGH